MPRARCALAMTGICKRCSTSPGGRTEASTPTEAFKGCVGEGLCPSRRAGKSAKRRQWRMKRAGFEEVPRLAATTVAGNRLARRWAREPRPYGEVAGGAGKESPSHGCAVPATFRQGGLGDGGRGCPCCGGQNFCAALRRTLEILTAATRSPRFFCHWQRSARSPRPVCELVSQ